MTTEFPRWFTSSYSTTGGECVEVATNLVGSLGSVPVRDSKRPTGPVLDVAAAAFTAFVTGVKGSGFGNV
ncbi:DUF397 domain-containing protein [Streptomyces sp. SR27]|uniref:DUF397 domain-containing protein n=1 Tax=Streptomyces sp. SR27 TaxID=3076630 RepID=UPI00295B4CDE|nr:DUF397 domain-containing protein [Streptomyces sp. SR27]MDV9187839.1 DUF397 domain-containing protein [Streptomyces sp. SR27]